MDRDLTEFERRLQRIDRTHAAGGGFEASGALSRADFDQIVSPRRDGLWMRPMALLLAGFLLFKGGMHAGLGARVYDLRVDQLAQGNALEQLGAWIMHADGLTLWVSGILAPLFP
ncbi:hypothetical protein [Phaeovulum vinaykumarii]|uniref:Uncharacterized protein n=1 Tax=Phaeovulum vinaykumarii TaxID=407234 RepID=A0A1N7MLY3_9RHOB|nr:hypothetical protein [Phaeovulum vinaykumarii]SIS87175.1 hypothetical protein SAMN05421795_10881 [Phaeovulum vinaykumarii]SOC13262.1 hypothetical protein SAMN05878426_10865 [Phaeovulum vinaykumarii]